MSNIPNLPLTPGPSIPELARAVNSLLEGASNSVGTVTLTNGGTTTMLKDNHITPNCFIFFWAQTAHAAAVASSLWYDLTSVPLSGTQYQKQITLNHSSSAQADLTFGYVILI
jgi:hypothetical protein